MRDSGCGRLCIEVSSSHVLPDGSPTVLAATASMSSVCLGTELFSLAVLWSEIVVVSECADKGRSKSADGRCGAFSGPEPCTGIVIEVKAEVAGLVDLYSISGPRKDCCSVIPVGRSKAIASLAGLDMGEPDRWDVGPDSQAANM